MRYTINLLQIHKKEVGLLDKIVYFFLNYLRYIFVITQLIIIGVFFYRFKIDQSIVDLKESVDQKQEIIQVVYPLIKQAESIDRKMKEIKKTVNDQNKAEKMIDYLLSIFPEKLSLSNLTIEKDSLKLIGSSADPTQLQLFYRILKKDSRFESVELQSLKKNGLEYNFVLTLGKFKAL